MTPAQIKLLKKCISALRNADEYSDDLVEVGWINGVDPRTAESLVNAGILKYDMPPWANEATSDHVRFPRKDEINLEE